MLKTKSTNTLKKRKPRRKAVDPIRRKRQFAPGRRHWANGSSDRD